MEYTKLGSTDIKISKICVGCMSFGKAGTMHDWTLDESATEEVVKHALDLGINFFDTANGYSAGTLRSKTDRIEMRDMEIVRRIQELAEGHGSKMQQIALAWHWAKGVASPIVGGTKMSHYDDAAGALDVTLTPEEVVYLEEPYLPHRVVGAVDHNPLEGVMLPDEKK